MKGTVYKSTGSWYSVKSEAGRFYPCRIKGKFRIKDIKSTNPVAVGDQVQFTVEQVDQEEVGLITAIEDRRNYIIRKAVKLSSQTHIIAANIDQVFLLVTLKNPKTYTAFIDRFLATAVAYDIPAVLLFNKMDQCNEEELKEVEALAGIYRNIGYTCLLISATTGSGVDDVRALMEGKTNMFAGNSGVGKSTLINAIDPNLDLRTTETSEAHLQGQHTTTFAEMYDLDFNARIIDTPGIRGFGMVDMEADEISDYFPEIFKLKADCKFNDCLHLNEPQCAVKEALDSGDIAQSRYRSYVQMVKGEEDTYRMDTFDDE